jgi:two-component system, LuxR family, response regulator FixJ
MRKRPRVFAVDDDPLIRDLLVEIFNNAKISVESYASAEEFLNSYSPADPGCILIDMVMPGMSGLDLQQLLVSKGNYTPIIFLTGSGKVQFAVEALKAGAVDFLEKPIVSKELLDVIGKAMELDMSNRYDKLEQSHVELKLSLLTPRESEVMQLMIAGNANKVIARTLGISSRTVEIHRKNIIDKMEASSLVDLVNMTTHHR